ALPVPAADTAGRAPVTWTQRVLGEIFAEVLQVPGAGVDDDFFALGGHSLNAARVISRIRARLGAEVPLRALFEQRTPAGLARLVDTADRAPVPVPVVAGVRPVRVPLSFGQRRLWFVGRLEGPSSTYSNPLVSRLVGRV